MGLCPAGQSTTIEWQYPNELKQRIIGADDYSIVPAYSAQTRYFWQYEISEAWSSYSGTNITAASRGCNGVAGLHRDCSGESRRSNANSAAAKRIELVYAPIYKYRVTDFKIADYPCTPGRPFSCSYLYGYRKIQVLCHGGAIPSTTPVWVTLFDGTQYAPGNGQMLREETIGGEFNMAYNQALNQYSFNPSQQPDWNYFRFVAHDNRLPYQYQFKVTKDDAVVYQRININAPTVTYFCGESCPPGTCECTCGNRTCCHDPITGTVVKSFIK